MAKAERTRPRVHRLEPERPAQDHDLRVLAAHRGTADRVDAGHVGRGARRARTRRRRRALRSKRPPCSNASPTATTTTRRRSPCTRNSRRFELGRLRRGWNSTAKSPSSPERAAASARRPRSLLAEQGCKVVCAARRDRRRAGADPRHDRRDRPHDHRRGRHRDRGADQPRQGRRGRAHDRGDRRAVRPGRHARQQRRDHVPRRPRPRHEALRPRDAGRPARAAASRSGR